MEASANGTSEEWQVDEAERRDFLHRIRALPSALAHWRTAQLQTLLERADAAPSEARKAALRDALDEILVRTREVHRILRLLDDPHPALPDTLSPGARRVLARMRLDGALWALAEVRAQQEPREPWVPWSAFPGLRRRLTVLGNTTCREDAPDCGSCELRLFCAHARRAAAERAAGADAFGVIDLFAGAGGVSEGFREAGFRVLLALDQNPVALRTLRLNHPEIPDTHVVEADIRTVHPESLRARLGDARVDVLIGAPPCQGFSSAGFRSKPGTTGYKVVEDARNYLFEHVVQAARVLRPRLLLLENVPGMESARRENVSFLELAARMLEEHGFRTAIWRLNAAAFGVPQLRQRCFLVASAGRLLPPQPVPEYQDLTRAANDPDALPPITLAEAIFDLPPLAAGEGEALARWDPTTALADRRARRYLTRFGLLRPSRILFNHTVRYHNPRDLELYALLQPGEDSVHALEKYGRADLMRYRSDVFDDKYARLRGDRPCKTIVSHLAKDGNGYIHPTQVRSISFREAARVQSFHDGHAFCGSPSDQWIQLGNAVPPVLARAIARSFLQTLRRP